MGTISTVMDKLAEKATDFVCNKFKKVLTTKELKNKFTIFSYEYFKMKFESCDFLDEFDFIAVEKYLYDNLDNKIVSIFYEVKNIGLEGQDRIRENILKEAIEYCKGNSSNENAIRKYCNAVIDFVGDILYGKILDSDKLFAAEITSVINEHYKSLDNKIDEIKDIERRNLSKIEYLSSFSKQIDNMGMPKVITINEFSYTNPNIGFYGRKTEQEEIEKFMNDNRSLLFWSVIGRGGVGKSKFALHICQKYEHQNWKSVWLNHKGQINQINQISDRREYYKNLLIVCDYAGTFIDLIKDMLLDFPFDSKHKIRVLLLERSDYIQSSNDVSFIYSDVWYNRLLSGHNRDEIKEIEYHANALNLDNYVLSDEDMFSILDDFSRKELSITNKKDIIDFIKNRLNNISRKGNTLHSQERCLFLLFTADAFLHGNDYKEWDTKALIENYIKRFGDNLKANYSDDICGRAYIILAIASAIGTIDIESDKESIFSYYVNPIKDELDYNISINKLKTFLSALCEKDTEDLNIYPMLPDLVGEFFFICVFNDLRTKYKHEWFKVFFSEKYQDHFSNFLKRCLNDWHSLKNLQEIIKELLTFAVDNNFNRFVEECVNNSFFVGLSNYYKFIDEDLIWLKSVLLSKKEEKFYIEYSGILVNVSNKTSDIDNSKAIVDFIENDILSVFNTHEIVVRYSKALINASAKLDNADKIFSMAKKIKDVALDVYNTVEIAEAYATTLFNASTVLKKYDDILDISEKIKEEVFLKYNSVEIAELYAMTLVNASCVAADVDVQKDVANRIKNEVLSKYDTVEIAEQYALALVVLSNTVTDNAAFIDSIFGNAIIKSEIDFLYGIIEKVKVIFSKFKTAKIAELYVKTFVNVVALTCDVTVILNIADEIENKILSEFRTAKIAEFYAQMLFYATLDMLQDKAFAFFLSNDFTEPLYTTEIFDIIKKIKLLLSKFKTVKIAEFYVETLLISLEDYFNVKNKLDIAKEINSVLKKYSTKEIAKIYINALQTLEKIYTENPEHEYLLEEIKSVQIEYNLTSDDK